MKVAIITGVTGQDGAYLSALLLKNNYTVIGLVRNDQPNWAGLAYLKIKEQVELVKCNLLDIEQVRTILIKYQPDEIYNLAAQSSVSLSFEEPITTFEFNTLSVFNLLESIKSINKEIRFYQASSSEMCGKVNQLPITENSILHPLSPYATSKVAAHFTCTNYRESYGMYIACGILFNHESYLRNDSFFVKKVIQQSIQISLGNQTHLEVGNIDVKRDFGYSPAYVEAMYKMLQKDKPGDYLVCSGESISLREIIYHVFSALGISRDKCVANPKFYRPNEIQNIYGDNAKAKRELEWDYDFSFYQVLDLLIAEELANVSK
ncbi:GDP-mannose 4,6-dehydratase [Pedobacter polaris]|uniref:GDP-mannose 4,6-dehydratase n=1 Tax=Pedobacter polaris TaxID=2571273 RepID=A0A4U1CW10_9SPHI|nr:GDP-mannose 4,6-dehydratase [Pedobacter polaris]TKC12896.1 GDP-mannose 4,6-dehydratase [Pedobacter polaris]